MLSGTKYTNANNYSISPPSLTELKLGVSLLLEFGINLL